MLALPGRLLAFCWLVAFLLTALRLGGAEAPAQDAAPTTSQAGRLEASTITPGVEVKQLRRKFGISDSSPQCQQVHNFT